MRESRPLASRERQPCREMESPFRWVESRATRLHQSTMSVRPRTLAAGFVWPCLPTKTHEPPSGGLWIHEIKHDGFRIIARKNGESTVPPSAAAGSAALSPKAAAIKSASGQRK